MKHKLLTVLFALVAALCLCFGLTACGGGGFGVEGQYYLVEQNKYDMQTYFTLKGGKWTDEDGISGDYETDGEKITLFTDMFGQKMEFMSGTVKDGVLDLKIGGDTKIFAKEGAWKGTSGGSQTPSAKEYTVTYDANGGAFANGGDTSSQVVKEGVKLTAPTSPTRSNYTFAGWARSKNGSTMWKFDEDTVSENTTLYAQWTQESAVILSVEGASIEDREIFMLVDRSTGSVSLSGKIVCSDDSIWRLYSDPEGQREIPTKMVTNLSNGNNTYYIVVNSQNQAQVNVYQLTVHRSYRVLVSYYNGESLLKTEETDTGDKFTADYKPDITGYTFNKWKTVSGKEFTADVLWGATSLYADKTANTYKATLNVNGGDALTETEKTMTYDKTYSFPVPRRTGYSFVGWYVGYTQITSANGASLSEWQYAGAQNVTAHWQANNYAVTLKQNDNEAGTVSGGGDYAYDSQVTITATTNKGYNFLGWYDKDDEIVSDKAQYTFKMGFAVSYTAKWDYYTLTTTRNNTSAGTLSKYYSDEKVTVGTRVSITVTTNKGYTWVGWYNGETELTTELTYSFTMGKENVNAVARWELVDGMEKFNFTSTLTTCKITGMKDETATEIVIPDCVTEIGYEAFKYCRGLTSVTIGNGVTSIGSYAFRDCDGLTSIEIPDSVKSIGEYAFHNCYGLTSVMIGRGLTEIGGYPFSYCYKLIEVWNYSQLKFTEGGSSYDNIAEYAKHVYTEETPSKQTVKDDYIFYEEGEEVYLLGYVGEATELTLPTASPSGKNYTIYNYAFYKCNRLTSVTIGSGVTSIEYRAFEQCDGLTGELEIPDSVTSIETEAFFDCDGLISVTIGSGSIGNQAFSGCGLISVTIGSGVTSIGSSAFSSCRRLTSVTIGSGVTSIGDNAFSKCYKIIEIWNYSQLKSYGGMLTYGIHVYTEETPSKQTVKDDYLFYEDGDEVYLLDYVGDSTELTLPTTSPSGKSYKIYSYAFYYRDELTRITIPDSVTLIGYRAFNSCYGLTSVTIGDGVTTIGEEAFQYCSGLKSVTIGSGVTEIGYDAFYNCYGLTSVYYKGTPSEWSKISINYKYNSALQNATRYYFSDRTPTEEQWRTSKNWWHYDEDGETIVLWTK